MDLLSEPRTLSRLDRVRHPASPPPPHIAGTLPAENDRRRPSIDSGELMSPSDIAERGESASPTLGLSLAARLSGVTAVKAIGESGCSSGRCPREFILSFFESGFCFNLEATIRRRKSTMRSEMILRLTELSIGDQGHPKTEGVAEE